MKTLIKQEKGIALVITMMLILVMSVMVAGFMLTIITEQKLGSNQLRYIEALNLAEAGISETAARLGLPVSSSSFIGEYGFNPSSPSWEGRVLNATNLPSPPLGSSIIYYSTLLAGTAQQLPYTVNNVTSPDTGYTLTVKYKTNSAGTGIYYYDFSTGQEVLVTGAPYSSPNKYACPIWVVRSTGMVGNVRRTIEAELTKNRIDVNITAAVASDAGVYSNGAFSVCGHNHPMATPIGTRIMVGNHNYPCMDDWELCQSTPTTCGQAGCLPGITTTDDQNQPPNGGGTEKGYPVGNSTDGTFMDLWDVLSCGDETTMRDTYNITTISDPDDILAYYQTHNNFGFVEYTGDIGKTGSSANELRVNDLPDSCMGILWVRGPFNAVGAKAFKGIIFIEGELTTSNQFWMLGAMMVRGDTTDYDRVTGSLPAVTEKGMHFRGNVDLLYSSETIQYTLQQLRKEPAGLKQLNWREINL